MKKEATQTIGDKLHKYVKCHECGIWFWELMSHDGPCWYCVKGIS